MTRFSSICARALGVAALAVLQACASSSTREWPATQVSIDDMRFTQPLQLSVNYKTNKGSPSGTTVLRMQVDEKGVTQRVVLLKSSGRSELDQGVLQAALSARFQPYLVDGQPVAVTVLAPMHLK
ncbi:energy transducer TonB [Variovorax sp. HJSM1_2]|uniref:energy transducer TonB n=1 Tax=Variovorax sp. HJSM1_2 TaxID=3366263 RepID=UPI003BE045F2